MGTRWDRSGAAVQAFAGDPCLPMTPWANRRPNTGSIFMAITADNPEGQHLAATSRSVFMPLSMPARLADGLGLKGALVAGCPATYAPSGGTGCAKNLRNLVPPRPATHCHRASARERVSQMGAVGVKLPEGRVPSPGGVEEAPRGGTRPTIGDCPGSNAKRMASNSQAARRLAPPIPWGSSGAPGFHGTGSSG